MDISTTETTRTAIGKPLQMRKQHQHSPDTTLCSKTNKNDKEDNTVTALFQLAVIMTATNTATFQRHYWNGTTYQRWSSARKLWRHSRSHSTVLLKSRVKWCCKYICSFKLYIQTTFNGLVWKPRHTSFPVS
jgi:hypothetical protein